ncbi:MAG TPA: hypothetical protein VJQ61_14765 [Sinomonas sp.]|nr:hypothetical protein [Sinomonas sp.]
MADIYMYADETGNLDYDAGTKDGASTYFGFGTATFDGDHGDALFQGLRLRAELEGVGVQLKDGFHAKNDSARTKSQVFYGLWAVQRDLEGKRCGWLGSSVEPTLQSVFMPWGTTG